MWKQFISSYLDFTKKERTGICVLLCLVFFFVMLPFFYPYLIRQKTYDRLYFEKAVAALQIKEADNEDGPAKRDLNEPAYKNYASSGQHYNSRQLNGELFYFDPNSASPSDWKRLGVRDKTIATIQNYLSKGGKFYKKEDISKIWGLYEDEIQRLTPYIRINSITTDKEEEKPYEKKAYKKPVFEVRVVDINADDTTAFIALPGIGGKLSQRIINFRDRLGGFYKVEQIGETFGLPDSTFQKIKPLLKISGTAIKKININTATIDEMKLHPYIRYVLANAIFQYRAQHGNYAAVSDIKKLMLVTEEIFNKLVPYLTVE